MTLDKSTVNEDFAYHGLDEKGFPPKRFFDVINGHSGRCYKTVEEAMSNTLNGGLIVEYEARRAWRVSIVRETKLTLWPGEC